MVLLWAFCFTSAYLISFQIDCVPQTKQVLSCWGEIMLARENGFVKTIGKFSRWNCQVDKHITLNPICIPRQVQTLGQLSCKK